MALSRVGSEQGWDLSRGGNKVGTAEESWRETGEAGAGWGVEA